MVLCLAVEGGGKLRNFSLLYYGNQFGIRFENTKKPFQSEFCFKRERKNNTTSKNILFFKINLVDIGFACCVELNRFLMLKVSLVQWASLEEFR